ASAAASILILVVLALLPYLEARIDRWNQSRTYLIHCLVADDLRIELETLFRSCHLRYNLNSQVKEGTVLILTWIVQGRAKNHDEFIQAMLNDERVRRFEY
ncbi:MAG TPA: hypothetical protein VF476_13855, partial [Chitinophagaceae bacterium]